MGPYPQPQQQQHDIHGSQFVVLACYIVEDKLVDYAFIAKDNQPTLRATKIEARCARAMGRP